MNIRFFALTVPVLSLAACAVPEAYDDGGRGHMPPVQNQAGTDDFRAFSCENGLSVRVRHLDSGKVALRLDGRRAVLSSDVAAFRRTLYRRTRFVRKRNRVAPERRRSLFRLYRCLRQFGRNFLPRPLNGAACLNRRPDFSGGFLYRFCFGRRLVPAVFGRGGLFFVLFRVYSIGSGSMPTLNLLRFLQGCYPMIK